MPLTLDHDAPALAPVASLPSRLARQKKWFIASFLLTITLVGAAFSSIQETYRASASLMVASSEAVLATGGSSAEAQRLGDPADIESQMLMLRSPRLARVILDDPAVVAGLTADCEATRKGTWLTGLISRVVPPPECDKLDFRRMLSRLENGFSIGPTGRSRVIEVSFVSPVRDTAVIVANALIDTYLKDDKDRKVDTHDNAINWLSAEIARSGQELRTAELAVEQYRSENGIVRGQTASISSERLSALGQQLAAAQAAYAQALSRPFQLGTDEAPEVLNSRTIADLKQQAAVLASRAADLRQRLGDAHPAVVAAVDQKREIDRRLAAETARILGGLQKDVHAAAARVSELKGQYDKLMLNVGQAGGAEAGIAIMVRDVEARREIYVEQLKKVNVLQTERRLLTGDARLVNHAELPDRPWFPKKLPFVGIGTVLATVVGAGMSLMRDRGDRTFRATSNLPALAGIPIMGYVPWVRRRRSSRVPTMHLDAASPLEEAIRALFGRVVLVPGTAPKTIMVGSADIGEGKTFLTLSMALFAASTGRRVLVVEADLRRPTFGKALKLAGGVGLSEYLRGEAALDQIVGDYQGLHIITAGRPSVDSTELLSKNRLDVLLSGAEADYDLILVDSPPAMLLMDAHVMARRVDGIIFCASLGKSRLPRVVQGMRDLVAAGGEVLGLVVSGASGVDGLDYGLPGSRTSYRALPA